MSINCFSFFNKFLSKIFCKEIIYEDERKIKYYKFMGITLYCKVKRLVNYNSNIGLINYKNIHILHKNIHNVTTVKMLRKHFSNNDNAYVFVSGAADEIAGRLFCNNVFYGNIDTLEIDTNVTTKIIVHGMFFQKLITYLYENKDLLKITYWAIHGGDLYSSCNSEEDNYVRSNVKAIISTFDKEEYIKRYGKKECFDVIYDNPLRRYINKYRKCKKSIRYRIMINNSSDESTLEMLDILARYKDENIYITTILSYDTFGQKMYRDDVLKKGKDIFGEKFVPLLKWQEPKDYIKFLSGIDIYISNQDRQQGVGNISILLHLGKKVFVKSSVSTFTWLKSLGIKVYDTFDIKKMDFNTFIKKDIEDIENNKKILNNRYQLSYQLDLWRKIIE